MTNQSNQFSRRLTPADHRYVSSIEQSNEINVIKQRDVCRSEDQAWCVHAVTQTDSLLDEKQSVSVAMRITDR